MQEGVKDKLIGGFIGFVFFLIGALIVNWWNEPSAQNGIILHIENSYTERTRTVGDKTDEVASVVELKGKEFKFFNLKNDLSDSSIIIPIRAGSDAPIFVESDVDDAIISSISNIGEIQKLGLIRVNVEKMKQGGKLTIRAKTPSDFEMHVNSPESNLEDVKVLPPSVLYIYL
jgi:hypothetical protein